MSEALRLATVLAAASEATSNSNGDRVLIIDSDGIIKRSSFGNIQEEITFQTTGGNWYRVLTLGTNGNSTTGSALFETNPMSQESFFLRWNIIRSARFLPEMLDIFNPVSREYPYIVITKLRVVYPHTSARPLFIDLFVEEDKTMRVVRGTAINATIGCIENPIIPSDYDSQEYDMNDASLKWGGVNDWYSIVYKSKEEGGTRHERSDEFDGALLRLLFGRPLSDSNGSEWRDEAVTGEFSDCSKFYAGSGEEDKRCKSASSDRLLPDTCINQECPDLCFFGTRERRMAFKPELRRRSDYTNVFRILSRSTYLHPSQIEPSACVGNMARADVGGDIRIVHSELTTTRKEVEAV